MKSKRTIIFILVPTLIVILLSVLYFTHIARAKDLIYSFLDNAINLPDFEYKNYMHPRFEGDLNFVDFLRSNKDDIQCKVKLAKKANIKEYRVLVDLKYNGHKVPLDFKVLKDDGKWFISELPEYSFVPAGLFLGYENESNTENLKFDIKGNITSYPCAYPLSLKKTTPISMHIIGGYILKHDLLRQYKLNKVLRLDSTTLEDIHIGNIKTSKEMPVYIRDTDSIKYTQDNFIPIGTMGVHIYTDNDDIVQLAIYDSQSKYRDNIRVLINNSSHESTTHKELNMLCGGAYIVRKFDRDDFLEFKFQKGDILTFKPSTKGIELYHQGELIVTDPNRLHIQKDSNSIMHIQDIQREFTGNASEGTPYRGDFEVAVADDGLFLINELPIEEYLYSVVTSEMPVSFGLEALKVQAITARAYALASLNRPGFAAQSAHIDDSTASQMYNNTIEHPTALNAVQTTAGLVPFYEDEIVDTRFFSTSPGYTAASNEVWSDSDGKFPGLEVPYLPARPQYIGDSPSLHNDENFRAFIDNVNDTSYDRFSPFFRWTVKFSKEVLEASIHENLAIVQSQQPGFVLTRVEDSYHEAIPIPDDIGKLLNIEVLKRGHGGNIMELELSTTSGNYKIVKELNIRNVLKPINYIGDEPIELKCYDGSLRENFPLLPSAFAYIDIERDGDGHIVYVTITGGGYGHGVGMSQYGTYGLTLLGKSYKQIINHYYPGCELKKIY